MRGLTGLTGLTGAKSYSPKEGIRHGPNGGSGI